MSRFVFRLQALLGLRESERESRRAELATAIMAERQAIDSLKQIEASLAEQVAWQRDETEMNLAVRRQAASYSAYLQSRKSEAQAVAQSAAAEVVACQQRVLEADIEVRMLEKLRERQETEWRDGERRAEERALAG